jgi:ATP-dependent DNA helicase RecG
LNRAPAPRPSPRPALARPAVPRLPEAVQRLRRVLELELRRGCDNGAVIGGLDRFLAHARSEPAVVQVLALAADLGARGYAGLPVRERRRWIRQVLEGKAPEAEAPAGRRPAARVAPPKPAPPADPLAAPVTVVPGVKEGVAALLAKLDVRTVRDLLFLFPNRHNDFSTVRPIAQLEVGVEQTLVATVWTISRKRLGVREGTEALVSDDTGTLRVVWFNQPYIAGQLKAGERVVLSGKITVFNGRKTMESPEWERVETDDPMHTGRLVPVYPLTQGLSQRQLRRLVKTAVDRFATAVPETLPADLRERHGLAPAPAALRQVHYPDSHESHEQSRRRFAFEEILCVQLAVLSRRLAWQAGRAPPLVLEPALERFRSSLPFRLTGAQERAVTEVAADLSNPRPMARLLQGDVGSGKTAVAAAALAIAVANGYQGSLMAPTEILAEQHFKTLAALLARASRPDGGPLRAELLTGSRTAAAKRKLNAAIAAGEVDVAVGTHALIQEGVAFPRLGLAIVDEQHRFGVMQRAALRERLVDGVPITPHLLVMSATPIPRTLSLTLFGDLDASVIDEMPPGRLPVETRWVAPEDRAEAYRFVRGEIEKGRQTFVVCPLIDESEALQTRAAAQEYERLSGEVFPDLSVVLLHGRMAAAEKDAVLSAFRAGRTNILVSTTVIEVGIDIPNATVMLIEGADRFGLAQLHQLRGRVGRGGEQSYCLLLSDDPSPAARERLRLMEETNDGFALAEADLRLRGPGDYFGTRQSGQPEFIADFSDVRLVERARREAARLLAKDPALQRPEHAALAAEVARAKRVVIGEIS